MKFIEEYYASMEENSLKSPNALEFLKVKKSIKGFSASFWILISSVFSVYIGLSVFWYDALPKSVSDSLYNMVLGLDRHAPIASLVHLPEDSDVKDNSDMEDENSSRVDLELVENHSLTSSEVSIDSNSVFQNPTALLDDIRKERIEPKLTAREITPDEIKTKRVRTQHIDVLPKKAKDERLESGSVEVIRPKYQQLYGSAVQALSDGRLSDANQLIDEALYIKTTPEAHAFKLRLYLLIAVDKVAPYIAQHQLPIESSSELMAIYAQAHQKLGNYEKSLWAYEQLVVLEPLHEGWFLGLALSLEQLGKIDAALKSYYKAIQLTQDSQLQHFAQQRIGHLKSLLP